MSSQGHTQFAVTDPGFLIGEFQFWQKRLLSLY